MLKRMMLDVIGKFSRSDTTDFYCIILDAKSAFHVPQKLEHMKVPMIFDLTVRRHLFIQIRGAYLLIIGGSAGGYEQNGDYQQQPGYVEVSVEPSEATVGRGEEVTLTCNVKGSQQYTVKWGKYSHDTSLPSYARVCINH